MQLQLVRYCYGPDHVAGLLKYGENFSQSVWTLECPWRENKVFISCSRAMVLRYCTRFIHYTRTEKKKVRMQ